MREAGNGFDLLSMKSKMEQNGVTCQERDIFQGALRTFPFLSSNHVSPTATCPSPLNTWKAVDRCRPLVKPTFFFLMEKTTMVMRKKLLSSIGVRDDFPPNYRDGGLGVETEF